MSHCERKQTCVLVKQMTILFGFKMSHIEQILPLRHFGGCCGLRLRNHPLPFHSMSAAGLLGPYLVQNSLPSFSSLCSFPFLEGNNKYVLLADRVAAVSGKSLHKKYVKDCWNRVLLDWMSHIQSLPEAILGLCRSVELSPSFPS